MMLLSVFYCSCQLPKPRIYCRADQIFQRFKLRNFFVVDKNSENARKFGYFKYTNYTVNHNCHVIATLILLPIF